jgi:cell wall-associated NlpC family hydrolase
LIVKKLFPLLLLAAVASFSATAFAQTNNPDDRPRYAVRPTASITPKRNTADIEDVDDRAPVALPRASAVELRFHNQLLNALESHVGAPYHFNRTGPEEFDCSGLVWRAFQDIGINFQRAPARSYWATFSAPAEGEQFKFGNLVFFNGLAHVGIVVDEKGFYHSARHGGVMYSPFNDYWLARIDGFRRVSLEGMQNLELEKRQTKPTVVVPVTDESPR